MQWNIDFDICAIVILVAIIFLHISKQYVPIRRSYIFLILTILELITIFANLMIHFGWIVNGNEPWSGFYILIDTFYALQYAVPIVFMYYMIIWSGQSLKVDKVALVFFFLPVAAYVVLIARNYIYHNFYVLDSESIYLETSEVGLVNGVMLYCMLYGLIYAIIHVRLLSFGKLTTIAIVLAVLGVAIVVQSYTSETAFIDFMIAFSLFILYYVVQNPSDMLDSKTQVMGRNMMDELMGFDIITQHEFDLVILAMDGFKFVNKTFGVAVGDLMLRQVATYLTTVCDKGRVYRYGADQFALQLRHEDCDLNVVLEKIKERFRHPWITEDVSVMLSATISCISYPKDGDKLENIIDVIDYSVLSAKTHGKGSIVYAKDMDLHGLREEKAIEKAIETAINNDTIEVYYQPIFNAEKNCYTSAEALVRVHDEHLGNISPEIFIPIVEKNGSIVKLGLMIFEKVCRFISEQNLKETSIEYIEVNVSVVQCMQQNFAEDLMAVMEKYSVDSSQINLEVTETAAANSVSILKENIDKLHTNGIAFSLDDYGSGYSTLGYLHHLPFQMIKLDKLMVWDAFEDERAGVTLKYTVGMLKELNMNIVAEGVETGEQKEHLTDIGCDYLQGWYYSKAVPPEEFAEMIRSAS